MLRNLQQLYFLVNNKALATVSDVFPKEMFTSLFLSHVVELLHEWGYTCTLSEPLLEDETHEDEYTSVIVEGIDVGSFYHLHSSTSESPSLVYYSGAGYIEVPLFQNNEYYTYTVSDYAVCLYEFTSFLLGQYILYSGKKNDSN